MNDTDSAGRLRRLINGMRAAHARDSLEWSRRMETSIRQNPGRRS